MDTPENKKNIEQQFTENKITDFVELVACIMDYYGNEGKRLDPEDKWKENSPEYNQPTVPENIDELVEKAFVKQLKRFI